MRLRVFKTCVDAHAAQTRSCASQLEKDNILLTENTFESGNCESHEHMNSKHVELIILRSSIVKMSEYQ